MSTFLNFQSINGLSSLPLLRKMLKTSHLLLCLPYPKLANHSQSLTFQMSTKLLTNRSQVFKDPLLLNTLSRQCYPESFPLFNPSLDSHSLRQNKHLQVIPSSFLLPVMSNPGVQKTTSRAPPITPPHSRSSSSHLVPS